MGRRLCKFANRLPRKHTIYERECVKGFTSGAAQVPVAVGYLPLVEIRIFNGCYIIGIGSRLCDCRFSLYSANSPPNMQIITSIRAISLLYSHKFQTKCDFVEYHTRFVTFSVIHATNFNLFIFLYFKLLFFDYFPYHFPACCSNFHQIDSTCQVANIYFLIRIRYLFQYFPVDVVDDCLFYDG